MSNYNELNNTELYQLIAAKNLDAFEFVYDRYSPAIYGLILQKVKLHKIADDILEKTFTAFFKGQLQLSSYPTSIFMRLHNVACSYIGKGDVLYVSHSNLKNQFPGLAYLNKQQ